MIAIFIMGFITLLISGFWGFWDFDDNHPLDDTSGFNIFEMFVWFFVVGMATGMIISGAVLVLIQAFSE